MRHTFLTVLQLTILQHENPAEYTVIQSLPAIRVCNCKDSGLVCTKPSGIFLNPICVMQYLSSRFDGIGYPYSANMDRTSTAYENEGYFLVRTVTYVKLLAVFPARLPLPTILHRPITQVTALLCLPLHLHCVQIYLRLSSLRRSLAQYLVSNNVSQWVPTEAEL